MGSSRDALVDPRSGLASANSSRISPNDALRFFDAQLASVPQGVALIRALIDPGYDTDPVPLMGRNDTEVMSRLVFHKLLPQLAKAVETGKVLVSSKMSQWIGSLATRLALRRLEVERALVEMGSLISAEGVEFLVLKGLATGVLDHSDPVGRQTSDVDILVRPTQFDTAVMSLARAGYERRNPLNFLDKGEAWQLGGAVVDIHTRLHVAGHPLGENWWLAADALPIAGHDYRTLPRSGRMAHAASHFAISYPTDRDLSSILDLCTLDRLASNDERVEAALFLEDLGVADIVSRITERVAVLVGNERLILGRRGSRPLDLVLRKAYDRPDLDLVWIKLAKTFGMPWQERRTAIRNLIAPGEAFLAAGGYRSRTDRLGRLLTGKRGEGQEVSTATSDGMDRDDAPGSPGAS